VTAELEPLLALVAERTGTRLSKQQRERLLGELQRAPAPRATVTWLTSREGAHELARLLSLVSVHKTDLFRDEQQLEALRLHVLAPLVKEGRPLHVWSAGCSTGEEVATLLILLAEVGARPDSTVLGTDLSEHALGRARPLSFGAEAMKRVPTELATRYFLRDGANQKVVETLARRASFAQHNLVDRPYPFSAAQSPFDVIVCRNVLIYFTEEAARATVTSFMERLRPGGVLVLSTAEPLLEPVEGLSTLRVPGAFFYQRGPAVKPPEPLPPPRASRPSPAPRASRPPPPPRPTVTGEVPVVLPPEEEGRKLFELVLEWAAAGEDHPETENGLRKALYLAPRLAAARYLLGLLLERRGDLADAANEYRRAHALLESGDAAPSAFFLNNERLLAACKLALQRLPRSR
jgi:chemotaxis protein methyltransferase CheR